MSDISNEKAKLEAEVKAAAPVVLAKAGAWAHLHVGLLCAVCTVVGFFIGLVV